ncbi:MAG: hypothetical protein KA296_13745 [Marinobacter sp.]|nr:hypothetical protein [Marinobacter sp.]
MGSSSKSSNTTKNTNFVNNNYGDSGGGTGSALADNLNMAESQLTTGDFNISSTDHGAVKAGTSVANKALDSNTRVITELADQAYDDLSEGREWAGVLAGDVVDQFQRTTEMALQRNAENVKQSFAFAANSERSDSSLALENITPWAFGAVIVIALVLLWSNRK